jgi:hypothetical protein
VAWPAPRDPGLTVIMSRRIFAILALISFVLIIRLGLGLTFFADEWAFIEGRSLGDPATWWPPHNEHWSTLFILVYRFMVETIGIGSYVPYLVVVEGAHLVVSALVYHLLETSAGPLIALIGGAIVLFFGSGFENLYWGFQMAWGASLALGLCAMVMTNGPASARRAAVVAALLLASMATSGIGIVMSIAVGVEWLLVRRWRRFVPVLFIAAAVFLAWFLVAGRVGLGSTGVSPSLDSLRDIPRSVLQGLSNGFGAITGLPGAGFLVLALFVGAAVVAAQRGRLEPRAIAIVLAVALQYALTSFERAQLYEGVVDYTDYTRYTYVSGILALVAAGTAIGRVELPAAGRRRLATVAVLGSWAAVGLVTNLGLLVLGRDLFMDRAEMTRALVTVALAPDRPADVDMDRSLVLVPSPRSLEMIKSAYGDPRFDLLVPWAVRPIPAPVLAEAQRRLVEGAPIPGLK